MNVKELVIGNLEVPIPVIQGGMGVGVSLAKLAGAVAAAGGIGVISTAQIGFQEPDYDKNPLECNLRAVGIQIKKAREIANGGILGVNIMVATRHYEEYVKAAVNAGIDLIISGAGLPMELPKYTEGSRTRIAPIVSSRKAFEVIVRYWTKKYRRFPDMIVVEGPMAGGHLGFSKEELTAYETGKSYDDEIRQILAYAKQIQETCQVIIPVVIAGGVFDRKDMEHYLSLGANGVQLATRFVTTKECDASDAYKQAYLDAKKEDIVIVKSPVGMPGRAIRNDFLEKVSNGERFMGRCRQCITTCKPDTAPYCISRALIEAVKGNLEEGLIFCGSNAFRLNKIETAACILEEFSR